MAKRKTKREKRVESFREDSEIVYKLVNTLERSKKTLEKKQKRRSALNMAKKEAALKVENEEKVDQVISLIGKMWTSRVVINCSSNDKEDEGPGC